MKYEAILIFGAPGSGKGTQGEMLGTIPGFLHTSTGDLFRSLDKQSEMGKVFAQYADKGLLVPDEFTIKLWLSHMERQVTEGKFDPKKDLVVMDGVPRNVAQARLLEPSVDVKKIIYLETADIDKMVERLKRRALDSGRADDADEKVIRNRMAVYERETEPVLACYDRSLVAKVEADQSIIRVHADVVEALVDVKEWIEKQR